MDRFSPASFLDPGKGVRWGPAWLHPFLNQRPKVLLSHFRFCLNERFLYEYDFSNLRQHQVRIEGIEPFEQNKVYPVCIGGVNAAPPEDCGGPEANMDRIAHHWLNPQLDALEVIADVARIVMNSQEEKTIREKMGDLHALQEVVEELKACPRFRPERFNRRRVNRRRMQYAHGDDDWRQEEVNSA